MRARLLPAVVCALAAPAYADGTQPYVVQPDDSCLGIAIRVLGEGSAVREIHLLNPQLGPLPHHLVPGQILTLPSRGPVGPDAKVARLSGDVKVRSPAASTWSAADRGMDLFRAYRVGAATAASAELVFGDDGHLGMRERTVVVIYGPEKRLAKTISASADLERGTLESRLGELDGKPLVLRTPAAETMLRAGDVVVSSSDGGPSVISNHRGAAIELRGRGKKAGAVNVAAGMGSRVVPGKLPEPPRPLPATPAWTTPAGPKIPGPTNTVGIAWAASTRAATYRIAVRDAAGDTIAAFIVNAPATTLEMPLGSGTYQLTIAALDEDGLESVPSPALEVSVVTPMIVAPNQRTPLAGAGTPRRVAVGTTLIAPAGYACLQAGRGEPSQRIVFERPGHVVVGCESKASRQMTNGLELDVVDSAATQPPVTPAAPLTMPATSSSAPSQTIDARLGTRAPVSWIATAGAYGGFRSLALRRPTTLGAPIDRMHALDDGPTAGLRIGILHGAFGLESEVGVSSIDHVDAPSSARVTGLASHFVLRHEGDFTSVALLAGIGLSFSDGDVTRSASWGGAASISIRGVDVRADLRHELFGGLGGGIAQGLQATLGASIELPKTM